MDENPFASPGATDDPTQFARRSSAGGEKPAHWHPLTWALIGFGIGTVLASPFVLSADPTHQVRGGMFFGGIPGALVGFASGKPKPSPLDGP